MKRLNFLPLFFLLLLNHAFAQSTGLEAIEKEIKSRAIGGRFTKQMVDLNKDQKDDVIYLYECGEPKCIQVFLNINGQYKEQVNEQFTNYIILETTPKKQIYLRLLHCCGESPYSSMRMFEFNQISAELKENYVLTNKDYVKNTKFLTPLAYQKPTLGKVTFDNYNLRFSPDVNPLKYSFDYGCEEGTNIIAKLKSGSVVQILSELIDKDRTWLFVEVNSSSINGKHNPVDFDFKGQHLRGWISSKKVERQN